MKPETHILLFRLLRLGMGREKADGSDSVGFESLLSADTLNEVWQEVLTAGAQQGIAAIMMDGLQRLIEAGKLNKELQPPREVKMRWAAHTVQVERQHHHHETAISHLAGFYSTHGVRMMLLKGYGLSLLYPIPSHRPCGDIDIWLYGDQQRADSLLRSERGVKVDEDHHHHTVFHFEGVMVENHYDFLNIHAHLSSRELEKELKALANSGHTTVKVADTEVHLPSADLNALFLLRHAGAHFAAGEIMLRHVTDWAVFLLRHHNDIDWQRLMRTVKQQNMHRFLHCLNGICIEHLGVPADIFPDFERDTELEARMLNDILYPQYLDKSALHSNFFRNFMFRLHRWWGNRWKHRMVYREGLLLTFLVQIRSHLMKPGEWA